MDRLVHQSRRDRDPYTILAIFGAGGPVRGFMPQGEEQPPSRDRLFQYELPDGGESMRILNPKRRKAKSSRRIAVVLLIAYFAMGAGPVDSSVLCLGEDGHLAIESAVSCALCGVRAILPVPQESLAPGESQAPGCGPCQDFSINSMRQLPGIAALPPPGSDRRDIASPSMEPAEGFQTAIASASSVSGPTALPDPIPLNARTVVLLI